MNEKENNTKKQKKITERFFDAILSMFGVWCPLVYSWGRGICFSDLISTIEFFLFALALGLAVAFL